MREEGVLAILDLAEWGGPIEPAEGARATQALEEGRVLFFPALSFSLQDSEKKFLSPEALAPGRKNISFDPETGTCQGSAYTGAEADQLGAMLARFAREAEALLRTIAPGYAGALTRARTSFRPADIEDRASSVRKDDRLLHVDAFPTRPTRGERILRVFSNIAPDGAERRWEVGEPFPDFAAKFLPRVKPAWAGSAWLMERLGLTRGRRSAYDSIMLALHDTMKQDARYQAEAPHSSLSFPPGTSWIVYTDQVLHAALAGRFALEQTFHLPVAAMAEPRHAPIRVLERLQGRALA
ncbi:MAG TPA: Kdo hydroxylase family protein [Acetobacteraceae bacterium]|nr:Kdo hydroxylase family protein [Acetobacteraceae bacterium]